MAPMTNADESRTNRLTLFPIYLSLFVVSTLWSGLSIDLHRMKVDYISISDSILFFRFEVRDINFPTLSFSVLLYESVLFFWYSTTERKLINSGTNTPGSVYPRYSHLPLTPVTTDYFSPTSVSTWVSLFLIFLSSLSSGRLENYGQLIYYYV